MEKLKITAKKIGLNFDFEVIKLEQRIIDIQLNGYINKIEYTERMFDWFIEDLVYFLAKNSFAGRWDFETVKMHNLESLKLTEKQLNEFTAQFPSVTNWDLEVA